jgi:hypothetical protein
VGKSSHIRRQKKRRVMKWQLMTRSFGVIRNRPKTAIQVDDIQISWQYQIEGKIKQVEADVVVVAAGTSGLAATVAAKERALRSFKLFAYIAKQSVMK